MTCPRCKREVDPWPLKRADVCAPKHWVYCIRTFESIIRKGQVVNVCHAVITSDRRAESWWWVCTCGDEGGPYDAWSLAWDATVDHERTTKRENAS